MLKRLSSMLPVVFFLAVIFGVGYLMWQRLVDDPTPSPEVTEASHEPVISLPVTTAPALPPIATSYGSTTVIPTITPSATATSTPIPTSTSTPIPTITYTLAPTSVTPSTPRIVMGIVRVENLNVRAGPGREYRYVDGLYEGDSVTILHRTSSSDWLEVETPHNRRGWVLAAYIGNIKGDIKELPVAIVKPPPVGTKPVPANLASFDIQGGIVADKLGPKQERWYTFVEKDNETVLVLIFRPNTTKVQFSIHYDDQIGQPHIVGVGSKPASDRDGNLETGELIWRGGPLVLEVKYYLHLLNNGSEEIYYCLAAKDVYQWSCSPN